MRSFSVLALIGTVGCGSAIPVDDMGIGDLTLLPEHCSNMMAVADEVDVDCGGSCAPCAAGKRCKKGTDCASQSCTNNACDVPACDDKIRNGDESDVDCGGKVCLACDAGRMCSAGFDCASL